MSTTTSITPTREKEAVSDPDTDDGATLTVAILPQWRFWCLSFGLAWGLFLAMLDTSIVATSLFTIGAEFGSLANINWVALAYTLAYLGCAVLFSRMADVFGRRNAFLAAGFIFVAFSIGCGFAQNLNQLIAMRALQGIGGSGLYSLAMIIWPELARGGQEQFIAGFVGFVIAMAGVAGPVLGGIITRYTTWRWIFWINGPIGAMAMVIFFFAWPSEQYLPKLERRSWKALDFVGSFLLIAAAVLVTFAFQNAGSDVGQWDQAIFLAPLVTGVFCWVALLVWELVVERRWKDSILAAFPMRLVGNRVYTFGLLNTMFLGFPFMLIIYAFPLHLQVVNGKSPLLAGVMLLPMLGGVSVGSFMGGGINGKRNYMFETLAVANCLMLIGCGLEMTLSSSPELEPKALGFLVLIGLGFGLTASTTTMLAVMESSVVDHAPAQGILAQFRVLGGSIGIAASSAILAVQETSRLGGIASPQQVQAEGGSANPDPELAATVRQTFSDAFREDMKVCVILIGVAFLLLLGTYRRTRQTMAEKKEEHLRQEKERRQTVPEQGLFGAGGADSV